MSENATHIIMSVSGGGGGGGGGGEKNLTKFNSMGGRSG